MNCTRLVAVLLVAPSIRIGGSAVGVELAPMARVAVPDVPAVVA